MNDASNEVPSGVTASLFPALCYRDAPGAAAWLERAFGFAPHALHRDAEGTVVHAEMRLGNGMVMFGAARPDDPENPWANRSGIYAVVEDIDAHYARAVAAGAQILRPLADTPYGAKEYTAADSEGNLWSFGTYRP
jgi:uncharacterized glyoxalase superfamily protein PhnB